MFVLIANLEHTKSSLTWFACDGKASHNIKAFMQKKKQTTKNTLVYVPSYKHYILIGE